MAYDYYADGDWNAICEVCGFKYKASMLKTRWDGVKTCWKCWEPRQPQDFVKGIKDDPSVPWSRDEGQDTFVAQFCTPSGQSCWPGLAIPGCALPGNTTYDYTLGP